MCAARVPNECVRGLRGFVCIERVRVRFLFPRSVYTRYYSHMWTTYASDSHSEGICLIWNITRILAVCPAGSYLAEEKCGCKSI